MPATADAKRRARQIARRLSEQYPDAACALHFQSPLELLVATILSAQCTDVRVNLVTPALFKRYPNAGAYASAEIGELERMIQSTGFFRNKAKNIKACCEQLVQNFGGEVPREPLPRGGVAEERLQRRMPFRDTDAIWMRRWVVRDQRSSVLHHPAIDAVHLEPAWHRVVTCRSLNGAFLPSRVAYDQIVQVSLVVDLRYEAELALGGRFRHGLLLVRRGIQRQRQYRHRSSVRHQRQWPGRGRCPPLWLRP